MSMETVNSAILAGFLLPHPPIVIPEVGKGREIDAQATITAFRRASARIAALKPETIVIVSPHAPLFNDYLFVYDEPTLTGTFGRFGAHSVRISVPEDEEFVQRFKAALVEANVPGGTPDPILMSRFDTNDGIDHGMLVPLHFILEAYSDFSVVGLSCSAFEVNRALEVGSLIAETARALGRKVCVVASGDLSHKATSESPYGMVPEGKEFDDEIARSIKSGDFAGILDIDSRLRYAAAECGYNSLVMLLGALGARQSEVGEGHDESPPSVKTELFSMEDPFGIGYCVAEFMPGGLNG